MDASKHLKYVMLIFVSYLFAVLLVYFSGRIELYGYFFVIPVAISALAYRFKGLFILFFLSVLAYFSLIYALAFAFTRLQITKALLDFLLFLGVGLAIAEMSEIQRRQRDTIAELAFRDKVTGAFTRNYFLTLLADQVKRAGRCEVPFSLAIVNVDDLSEFNYTFGFEKGNFLLNRVARILERNLRNVDATAYFGGGEFAVLMPCSLGDPKIAAERIRKAVEAAEFEGDAEQPKVKKTVSIGVSKFPQDASSVEDLIDKAVKAKDYAKKLGKNKVCDFSSLQADELEILSKN